MSKYDEKTDLELSKGISNIVLSKNWHCKPELNDGRSWAFGDNHGVNGVDNKMLDINNPDDMWPIIVDNNISITHYPSGDAMTFIQGGGFSKFKHESKSALRSAAITFLMMKELTK